VQSSALTLPQISKSFRTNSRSGEKQKNWRVESVENGESSGGVLNPIAGIAWWKAPRRGHFELWHQQTLPVVSGMVH